MWVFVVGFFCLCRRQSQYSWVFFKIWIRKKYVGSDISVDVSYTMRKKKKKNANE